MTTSKIFPFQSCGLLLVMSASSLLAQQIVATPEVAVSQSDTAVTAVLPKHPAEMAPNAPKVSCQGNQLTIQADNSTLRSILAAVHSCIGVEIELPEAFPDTRAYLQLGPGPAREVLDALLSSTDLNYIIQSSNAAPSKVETVLLMARLKDPKDAHEAAAPASFAMTPARRAWLEGRRNVRPAQPAAEESSANESESTEPATEAKEKVAATPLEPSTASPTLPTTSDASQPAQPSEKAVADAPATAETSATETAASPAPASDPSQEEPAKKVLQGKIGAMEQLFEQRKQMIAIPPAATDPH